MQPTITCIEVKSRTTRKHHDVYDVALVGLENALTWSAELRAWKAARGHRSIITITHYSDGSIVARYCNAPSFK
jgi:hypothetical protein